eukprot:PITA_03578
MLGISLDSPKTLLKYIGGLHSYMRHNILMFNPTTIDEVSVQATHLEAREKNGNPEVGGPSQPILRPKKSKGKKKKTAATIQKDLGSDSGDETIIVAIGIKVGGGELKIDPSKVAVILNWPKLKSATEVRSFLGAARYWRKFISNLSSIASPLHALTGLNKLFQWGGKQQKAFDTLKEKISTTPVLALPDLQRPFEIQTDSSDYAMGVVLTQHNKPICYHSETFNLAIVNYRTHDKELYALV